MTNDGFKIDRIEANDMNSESRTCALKTAPNTWKQQSLRLTFETVKDKAQHAVVLEKQTAERLNKDVQSYRLITVATLVDRLKINGSLARRALADLEEKGQIKKVVGHSSLNIYSTNSFPPSCGLHKLTIVQPAPLPPRSKLVYLPWCLFTVTVSFVVCGLQNTNPMGVFVWISDDLIGRHK